MADPFTADAQYNDLRGTVAVDGHSGPPLPDLAALTDMPKDYFPVGLSFHSVHVTEGKVPFDIVAVRRSEAGKTVDEMVEYARSHKGELPVYSFSGMIDPSKLESLFRRISIKTVLSDFVGCTVVVKETE